VVAHPSARRARHQGRAAPREFVQSPRHPRVARGAPAPQGPAPTRAYAAFGRRSWKARPSTPTLSQPTIGHPKRRARKAHRSREGCRSETTRNWGYSDPVRKTGRKSAWVLATHTERNGRHDTPQGYQEVKSPRHQFSGGRPSGPAPDGWRANRSMVFGPSGPRGQCVGVNAAATGAIGWGTRRPPGQTCHPKRARHERPHRGHPPQAGGGRYASHATCATRTSLQFDRPQGRYTQPLRHTTLSQVRVDRYGLHRPGLVWHLRDLTLSQGGTATRDCVLRAATTKGAAFSAWGTSYRPGAKFLALSSALEASSEGSSSRARLGRETVVGSRRLRGAGLWPKVIAVLTDHGWSVAHLYTQTQMPGQHRQAA